MLRTPNLHSHSFTDRTRPSCFEPWPEDWTGLDPAYFPCAVSQREYCNHSITQHRQRCRSRQIFLSRNCGFFFCLLIHAVLFPLFACSRTPERGGCVDIVGKSKTRTRLLELAVGYSIVILDKPNEPYHYLISTPSYLIYHISTSHSSLTVPPFPTFCPFHAI